MVVELSDRLWVGRLNEHDCREWQLPLILSQ